MRTLTRPAGRRVTVPTQRRVPVHFGGSSHSTMPQQAPAKTPQGAPEAPAPQRFRYRRLLAIGASALAAGGIALGAFLVLDDDPATVTRAPATVTDTGRDGGVDVLEQRILDQQRAADNAAKDGRSGLTVAP